MATSRAGVESVREGVNSFDPPPWISFAPFFEVKLRVYQVIRFGLNLGRGEKTKVVVGISQGCEGTRKDPTALGPLSVLYPEPIGRGRVAAMAAGYRASYATVEQCRLNSDDSIRSSLA